MRKTLSAPYVLIDSLRAERGGPEAIRARQQRRLRTLVAHARTASPYYRRLYAGLSPGVDDPDRLPPVAKPDLMAHFDEWVTDPDVTLTGLRRDLLDDPTRVGEAYLGRYHALTTSGTTGEPAVLLHDRDSWIVMIVIARLRIRWALLSRRLAGALRSRGLRVAALYAAGGHFGANVLVESARRSAPAMASRIRMFPVLQPVGELVAGLNEFQPTILSGYPSAIALLAGEQEAGRLRISPVFALVAGEELTPAMRRLIEGAWGCRLIHSYAASEVPGLALPCREGALHVNTDWYLLEPVDEFGRPVPPGVMSYSVLVTNLANRVQPVIRYDLGDRVRIGDRPCACGSPFPTVTAEGRTNDVLALESVSGQLVTVLPLALETVIEAVPGVHRFQLLQTGPSALTVRLEPEHGVAGSDVHAAVHAALERFLAGQGAHGIEILHDVVPPQQQPHSGKLRHVTRAL